MSNVSMMSFTPSGTPRIKPPLPIRSIARAFSSIRDLSKYIHASTCGSRSSIRSRHAAVTASQVVSPASILPAISLADNCHNSVISFAFVLPPTGRPNIIALIINCGPCALEQAVKTLSNFEIRTSGGGVGAFVDGINLANDLSDNVVGALRSALGEHGALYFRDQKLTPDDQIAFAEKFGEININLFFAHVDGYPKIAQVLKEPDQKKNIGGGWHTDHTYDLEPAMASMLHAIETPPSGGDTHQHVEAVQSGVRSAVRMVAHLQQWVGARVKEKAKQESETPWFHVH